MPFERVAALDEVDVGASIRVEIGGEPVALVRTGADTIKAVHNVCSHQQYDLAPEGFVEDDEIECALHGSMFDLDTGQPSSLPAVKPIPVYACKLDGGEIYVDVERRLNDAPVPRH